MTDVNPHQVLDSVTIRIAKVLLENPKIPYSISSLAEKSDVSRDAIYRRLETYKEINLIKESDVESDNKYYELDEDSKISNCIAEILYEIFEVEEV